MATKKEENVRTETVQEKKGALSYEELQDALGQANATIDMLQRDMFRMRKAIETLQDQNLMQYLGLRFKVVEHPEMFSPEFVDATVHEIEGLLTQMAEPEAPAENGK